MRGFIFYVKGEATLSQYNLLENCPNTVSYPKHYSFTYSNTSEIIRSMPITVTRNQLPIELFFFSSMKLSK